MSPTEKPAAESPPWAQAAAAQKLPFQVMEFPAGARSGPGVEVKMVDGVRQGRVFLLVMLLEGVGEAVNASTSRMLTLLSASGDCPLKQSLAGGHFQRLQRPGPLTGSRRSGWASQTGPSPQRASCRGP